jgi:predicted nucleotidyltransferase
MDRRKGALDDFVKRVEREYGPLVERVILFGSYARGEAGKESDIDVLVVVRGDRARLRKELIDIATEIMLDTEEYISVKVLTVDEFNHMKEKKYGFLLNILKEGVPIGRGGPAPG